MNYSENARKKSKGISINKELNNATCCSKSTSAYINRVKTENGSKL